MAYAQRHYIDLYDNQGRQFQFKIYEDGWGGGNTELTAYGDGIILEWPAVNNMFEPIRGSELTLSVKNDDNFDFKDFFLAVDYGFWKVEVVDVTDSSQVIWTGFSQAENYNEPFVDYPYPSKLTFTCGLGELKNVEFKDTSALHSGQMHIIEVLRHCLNGTNPLKFRESFNVYADGMNTTTADSPLSQTFVSSHIFREVNETNEEGMSCYDVVKAIMESLGCYIVQNKSRWWIVRSKEMNGNLYWRQFNINIGSESATTVASSGNTDIEVTALDTADEMTFVLSDAQMKIEERIRKVVYKYEQQKRTKQNLLPNGAFLTKYGIDPSTNLPSMWTKSAGWTDNDGAAFWNKAGLEDTDHQLNVSFGNIVSTGDLNTKQNDFIYMKMETDETLIWANILSQNRDTSEYIEIVSDTVFIQSGDKIRLVGSIRGDITDFADVPLTIKLNDVGTGTDYYATTGTTAGQMVTTEAYARLYCHPKWTSWVDIEERNSGWELPFTGQCIITFRIHKVHDSFGQMTGTENPVFLKNIGLKYQYAADGTTPGTELIVSKVIDNRADSFNIDALIGQGLAYKDETALRDSNGDLLIDWDRRDPTTGTLATENLNLYDIVPCEVLDTKGEFTRRITGTLYRQSKRLLPITRVSIPVPEGAGTTTIEAVPLGITWNMQRAYFKTTLTEINYTVQTPITTSSSFSGTLNEDSIAPTKDTTTGDTSLTDEGTADSTSDSSNYPL